MDERAMIPPLPLLAQTADSVTAYLKEHCGKGAYHAHALYRFAFSQGSSDLCSCDAFRDNPPLAQLLRERISLPAAKILRVVGDDVKKYSIQYHDGAVIESVLIPMDGKRVTLCVSSQVGCRMDCQFCTTALHGFQRNLTAEEIVFQLWLARFHFRVPVSNIVFMGMGEPLDNSTEVIQAIRVMSDPRGFALPPCRMTLSTAGYLTGFSALAQAEFPNLRIAISLNAARDELRSQLMPINRRFPLAALKATLQEYPRKAQDLFFVEYIVLLGINDTAQDASEIADFCHELPVRINLIPYNHSRGDYTVPNFADLERFREQLRACGINDIRIRKRRGEDNTAACGQLGLLK